MPPLVSVVTPLYTSAAHIGGVLERLRARTFADWEVVLVDNGSTDDTELHVAPFLADSRFRYLKQEHRGIAAGSNASSPSSTRTTSTSSAACDGRDA